jgi:hypothetical protein
MNHRTFADYALQSWCKERETYPSHLKVQLADTLTAGMHVHVEIQPQHNETSILGKRWLLSSPVLIDETLTESTAEHLTTALQAIHDQQGLVFDDGLCYMTLLYLVSYDLERMRARKRAILSPKREEHAQNAILPLWSLEDVLRFWDGFDGRLNRGFPPPRESDKGRWSYRTVPPSWLPAGPSIRRREGYRWTMLAEDHRSVAFGHEATKWALPEDCDSVAFEGTSTDSPSSVPVMVPARWKNWVENLVALLQVPEQHGVQINISLGAAGAAVAESHAAYVGEKNIFRQKGEVWDIVYQGRSFSLKDIKGLHYVKFLLRHPTKKFTPRQLSEGIGESVPAKGDKVNSSMSGTRLEELGLRSTPWDAGTIDTETMVDQQTINQLIQKLEKLKEEKEDAEICHNDERAAQLQDEMEKIAAYLSNTTCHGNVKRFTTNSDKIRISVTKRIRDAIDKIERHDDMLFRHLDHCIRTGYKCFYNPDPHNPITWSL